MAAQIQNNSGRILSIENGILGGLDEMDAELIIGRDPVLRRVVQLADRLASTVATVFLEGEPGTGRRHFARYLHARGPRAAEPLSVVDLGSVARGAAIAEGVGAAIGGTALIRNVELLKGEEVMDLVALLKSYPRVPRLVLASSLGLASVNPEISRLLKPLMLCLPPLRARRIDVGDLVRHFLRQESKRFGSAAGEISDAALVSMWAYDWPGNVGELRSESLAALLRTPDGLIRSIHLSSHIRPRPAAVARRDDLSGTGCGLRRLPSMPLEW